MARTTAANQGCLTYLASLGLLKRTRAARAAQPGSALPASLAAAPIPLPYRTRTGLLTPAERAFYGALSQSLDAQYLILPKQALDEVFDVAGAHGDVKAAQDRIAAQHVDFLICERLTLKPLVGIELGDLGYSGSNRFKDQVFEAAMLPLLRFAARTSYDPAQIAQRLNAALATASDSTRGQPTPAPLCPTHQLRMQARLAQRGPYAGQSFYVCPRYPDCQQFIPV